MRCWSPFVDIRFYLFLFSVFFFFFFFLHLTSKKRLLTTCKPLSQKTGFSCLTHSFTFFFSALYKVLVLARKKFIVPEAFYCSFNLGWLTIANTDINSVCVFFFFFFFFFFSPFPHREFRSCPFLYGQ